MCWITPRGFLFFFLLFLRQGLDMQPKMAWSSRFSCLSFPSARIMGVHHHIWQITSNIKRFSFLKVKQFYFIYLFIFYPYVHTKRFSKVWVISVCIPAQCQESFHGTTLLLPHGLVGLFHVSHSGECIVISHYNFNLMRKLLAAFYANQCLALFFVLSAQSLLKFMIYAVNFML